MLRYAILQQALRSKNSGGGAACVRSASHRWWGFSSTSSAGRPRYLGRPIRRRLPPGDDARALARLVVADQREVALELDDARQLAALVIGAADGLGGGLVDHEHGRILARTPVGSPRVTSGLCAR